MAFLRFAKAIVTHPSVEARTWSRIRSAATSTKPLAVNIASQAEEVLGEKLDLRNYLLTHVTIVASVDSEDVPNVKLGSVKEDGEKVLRKYSDYRVAPATEQYINNNHDCFERRVLLAAYKTFTGGHNFVEHVQIEEQSKGRLIDAVARDIGDSIYVDILVATNRRHRELIAGIESGEIGTLSMGCFLPGTKVSLADGTRVAIEDIRPGDMVLTHKGRPREVQNQQIRGGKWETRTIKVSGIPTQITSTGNHPFFVVRPRATCACGCGGLINEEQGDHFTGTTSRLRHHFKRGHDKRIFNPGLKTYSLEEYRAAKQRLVGTTQLPLEEVRADQLRVGDFLCLPRYAAEQHSNYINASRARLLGYFLAEGSFVKDKGQRVGVEFSFGLGELDTYCQEVAALVVSEFPTTKVYVAGRPDKGSSRVIVHSQELADWVYRHGGEYSHKKKLSEEVLGWPVEIQKELVGSWVNGDGGVGNGFAVTTVSYDLACQLMVILARCGMYPRLIVMFGGRSVSLKEVNGGGLELRDENGRLPSYNVQVDRTFAALLNTHTDKKTLGNQRDRFPDRVRSDVVLVPITSITSGQYDGWVYDLEVDEDHSYVVEGLAVHNCQIDFSICTKCGNVAEDETQMCKHVKYEKGNYFYDNHGTKRRVAELCGHHSVDPTGGVRFIEASWVRTPAFTGAVMRNILKPANLAAAAARKAKDVLATVPPEWTETKTRRAAGWLAAADDYGFEEALDGGDQDPAEEAAPEKKPEPGKMDKLKDDIYQEVLDGVEEKAKKEIKGPKPNPQAYSPNDNLQHSASSDYVAGVGALVRVASSRRDLLSKISTYNASVGVKIPPAFYQAVLAAGPSGLYGSAGSYLLACQQYLGRKPNTGEGRTLLRLGKLLQVWESSQSGGVRL